MPFIPGISTSSVMTSGLNRSTLFHASWALKLVATTSIRGLAFSPLEIIVRARMESSTTITRIFLFTIAFSPLPMVKGIPPRRYFFWTFWKVDGATMV